MVASLLRHNADKHTFFMTIKKILLGQFNILYLIIEIK